MVDYRKEWIKNRILTFFDETDHNLFNQMCTRHGNKVGRKLTEYLEDRILATHDLDRRLFVVFKTYYDRVVHEEVLVAEQGKICYLLCGILRNPATWGQGVCLETGYYQGVLASRQLNSERRSDLYL